MSAAAFHVVENAPGRASRRDAASRDFVAVAVV